MLETIFEWLIAALGEALEAVISLFMYFLHFDIRYIAAQFPILGQTYGVFRTIGIGLAVIFASVSIVKVTLGPMSESKETPAQVLFRLAISIGLIYFGGYALEAIINVVKLPYSYIFGMDAVQFHFPAADIAANLGAYAVANTVTGGVFGAVAAPVVALGAAAMLLISLVMIIVVFVNLIKLVIEVAQRIMWLFVILYTAPLAFSTYASKTTSEILRKWLVMFFSQCLLLVLSVWILNVAVSGFSVSDAGQMQHNFILQFLLTLAACKVGANLDREIQRIGLNPTTANGNLFDEVAGAFHQFGQTMGAISGSGKDGGSKNAPVLGSQSPTTATVLASSPSNQAEKPAPAFVDRVREKVGAAKEVASEGAKAAATTVAGPGAAAFVDKVREAVGAARGATTEGVRATVNADGSTGSPAFADKVRETVGAAKGAVLEGARAAAAVGGGPGAAAAVVAHTAQKAYKTMTSDTASVEKKTTYEGGYMDIPNATSSRPNQARGNMSPNPIKDVRFSDEAKAAGAHIAYSPEAHGAVISADTPQKAAAVWANSVGKGANSPEYNKVLSNTARMMTKESAVEAFSNPKLQPFNTKPGDATGVGNAFNAAVKDTPGVQMPAKYQAISTTRNQQTGEVMSKANFVNQNGRGMRTDMVNDKAYAKMPVTSQQTFQPVPGSEGKLYARTVSDNSRQVEAMKTLNNGGVENQTQMRHTIKEAYGEALKDIEPSDISKIKITPPTETAGAKVSFETRTFSQAGDQTIKKMEFFNGTEAGKEYDFNKSFGEETAQATTFRPFKDADGTSTISFAMTEETTQHKPARPRGQPQPKKARQSSRPPEKNRNQ